MTLGLPSSLAATRQLFVSTRGAAPLGAAAVALSGIATVFEGLGIVLVLPFLQKLIHGQSAALNVSIPQLRYVDAWLNAVPENVQLLLIGALICVSILLREGLTYLAGLIKLYVSMTISDAYRARLHQALIGARLGVSSKYHYGYFQNFLYTEANRLRPLTAQLIAFAESLVIAGTVLVLMGLISGRLSALVVGLLLIIGLPLTHFFRWVHRSGYGRVESRIEIMNYLSELMPFLRTVHVLDAQARERERFRGKFRDMFQRDLLLYKVGALVGPIYHSVGAISVLGIVFVAVFFSLPETAGLGWVIPFVLLFSRFLPILNSMNLSISALGDGFASYARVAAEMKALDAQRMADGIRDFPARFRAIELRRVAFEYDPGVPVLRDITLRIEWGRHVAIVGPSGCGKSTLCLLLCRLYDPAHGEVSVDGRRLSEFRLASLRSAVTLVEQTPVLLNDSIRNNIAYGWPDATDSEIRSATKKANADEFISEFQEGYDTNVGNLGTSLSGGQRQRIAIARALIRHPQVLILDEATSAVDSRSEALIKDAIEALRGEVTVVSVAHRLSTIKDADEIHFLSSGRIVCSGTFAELVAEHPEFRDYVKAQDLSDTT